MDPNYSDLVFITCWLITYLLIASFVFTYLRIYVEYIVAVWGEGGGGRIPVMTKA